MTKTILVTGGAGYIGSHTCVELMQRGHDIVILDNFSNARRSVIDRLVRITAGSVSVFELDVRDRAGLDKVFAAHEIFAVMHFAGLKSIGDSVANPLTYYDNNVGGSIVLSEVMATRGVKTLVFSSSATVYGDPETVPIRENASLRPTAAYGRSKLMVEDVLRDVARSDPAWRIGLLRYFNPVGAHESGLIGEDPLGIPENLMPYISQVASGRRDHLAIFGNDYPTPDGTGVRDYVHVMDLAAGHVAALEYMQTGTGGVLTVNLGTGRGYSVLEVLRAYERASGRQVPVTVAPRRPGDVATYYADPSLALTTLGWRAQRDIDAMCSDAWRWQQWAAAHPL